MAGVELGLGVVGAVAAVDVAIKYGSKLVQTCSAFTNAESEINERVLRIKNKWYTTKLQLETLSRICPALEQEHQDLQNELLTVLMMKLTGADSKISRFLPEGQSTILNAEYDIRPRLRTKTKFKYITLKKTLDEAIDDLESWQKEFDPSWFLILRVGGQHIDTEFNLKNQGAGTVMAAASGIRDSLKENPVQKISVRISEQELKGARLDAIPLSSVTLALRANSNKWLILDSVPCDSSADYHTRMETIRDLAKRLTRSDPSTFSLLKCKGFITNMAQNSFQLVFRTPDNLSHPQSLRSKLLNGDLNHSLSDRFRVATQLARAISFIHTFGLVHKSIRPENILIFRDQESTIGSAFLVGFEDVRLEAGKTRLRGDSDWEKNLYRHPQRQGSRLQEAYIMQHDIYSLGVCLLEIGLWNSFVQYTGSFPDQTISGHKLNMHAQETTNYSELIKDQLLSLARDELRRKMGSHYARVVEICLTCLDEGNEGFGDEGDFYDKDGVLVAVRYIEMVLLQLSKILV